MSALSDPNSLMPSVTSVNPLGVPIRPIYFYRCIPLMSEMVPLMNSDESGRSGGAYASLGTRQEGRRFEDIGLSLCALPL